MFHVIEDDAGPGTSHTDESVSAESRYVYRVKAVSPTGVSQWSGYANVDTPAAPAQEPAADPADLAPSGLTARAVSGAGGAIEGVALAWDAPAEDAASVTGYEILRAQGEAELATLVSDTDSALDNDDPRGIWSDGTTMWVADKDDNKVYTYALLRLTDLTRTEIWSATVTVTQSDIDNKLFLSIRVRSFLIPL